MSRTERTLELAVAKAGMDPKTARKYLADGRLPSEMKPDRTWRTRADPFATVWPRIREQLELNPGLEAKTIFEALQQQCPGEFSAGQLRTLQRRIRQWRAIEGPGREVFFRQEHVAGRLAQSDFTHMTELGVTIGGQTFPHLVFHFVLPYSGWEWVSVCYSESFESLSEGLQEALWALGGVPLEHQTDRMSTAVNNTSEQREFTSRYESLLRHYRMTGRKIQTGKANENGCVEQRHHRFKRAVEQTLIMRQSRDFQTIAQYSEFLKMQVARLNAGRRERVRVEMEYLKALPDRRTDSARRMTVRVDSGSMIYVDRNAYSVNSRLIGQQVEARLCADRVEIWYGQRKVDELPRLRGRGKHRADYRHIIDWLVRKPGAFEDYQYRDELFPTSRFCMAWDLLRDVAPARANKRYLEILQAAAHDGEARVDQALRYLLEQSELDETSITADAVMAIVRRQEALPAATDVDVAQVSLAGFDELLSFVPEVIQ